MPYARRNLGTQFETLADTYLQQQGLQLLFQNFRCRQGEIDLIYQHANQLVFVEVRFRRESRFGGASASVDYKKQQKLKHTARYFLFTHPKFNYTPCRFDVIAITLKNREPHLEWIQNAFI